MSGKYTISFLGGSEDGFGKDIFAAVAERSRRGDVE